MKRRDLILASLGAVAAPVLAQDKVVSGPQPGQAIQSHAFQVVDVNGPNKGKQLCYY